MENHGVTRKECIEKNKKRKVGRTEDITLEVWKYVEKNNNNCMAN